MLRRLALSPASRTGIGLDRGEEIDVVGLHDDAVPHARARAVAHLHTQPTREQGGGRAAIACGAARRGGRTRCLGDVARR